MWHIHVYIYSGAVLQTISLSQSEWEIKGSVVRLLYCLDENILRGELHLCDLN